MWDAAKCNLCGDCLVKCLYNTYDRAEAVAEIKKLRKGLDAEILHRCVTCYGCREYCPTGADPPNLIISAIEKAGLFSTSEEQLTAHSFGVPSSIVPGDPDKPALSLCTMADRIPTGTLDGRLFKGMTVVKGGDYYCLIGWNHYGHEAMIARYAQRFIDNLSSVGKDIVFLHDDCYAMVHVKIREYGIEVPFKYMHILEYLADYLRTHRNSITRLKKKMAYQQPCASRYTPEKNIFLDELFELIGVERPARRYERESALCCSAPLSRIQRDLSAEGIQEVNVRDAMDCGAEALITLCPVCDHVMRGPTERFGLKQIYITDLCRMALGEKSWPA